jgi:Putative MetA-pathway of phenol degradation
MKLSSVSILFIICIFHSVQVKAQAPNDAIYMPGGTMCILGAYGQSSWHEYWENKLKRENFNIGTNTTTSYMVMVAMGLTDKLNLIAGLPYIQTKNSAGNLLGQKGIQDFSATLKYKLYHDHGVSLSAALGASVPVGNYVPDFLPMSIGLHSVSATGRIIFNYQHKTGLYLTLHGGYTGRSDITVDRDAYQANDQVYNTHKVAIPNTTDGAINIGYLKHGIQATVFIEKFDCLGGDDIRRNDMPFPTNDMNGTDIGGYLKYQPSHFGVNFRYAQVTKGHNIGQATSFSAGILYQFGFKSMHKAEAETESK